jgi:hypothetical protein
VPNGVENCVAVIDLSYRPVVVDNDFRVVDNFFYLFLFLNYSFVDAMGLGCLAVHVVAVDPIVQYILLLLHVLRVV